jgi:chromosome partitioning protein
MSIISIANQKGGVGKTTTTVHLADFLSQKKLKTLVIDFDPQAHSTFTLCGHGPKAKKSLMDCFQTQGKNLTFKEILVPINPHLDLLPADLKLFSFDQIWSGKKNREYVLRDALKDLSKEYQFVLIDCPPQLGLLSINAFLASSKLIIPIDSSAFAIEGSARALEIVDLLDKKLKHPLDTHFLLTHYQAGSSFTKIIENELKKYQKYLFQTKIAHSPLFREASEKGQFIKNKNYQEFGEEFLKWNEKNQVFAADDSENPFGKGVKIKKNEVEFLYHNLKATEVSVVGDFNNWLPGKTTMLIDKKKNAWATSVKLKKGNYHYKFVVDGQWINDPWNPNTNPTEEGTLDTFIILK